MDDKADAERHEMKWPPFKVIGLMVLVIGLTALLFAVIRFNSFVSQALVAMGQGDPLLIIAAVLGVGCTLYGIVNVFAGVEASQFVQTKLGLNSLGLGLVAIYLILLAIMRLGIIAMPSSLFGILALLAGLLILLDR